MTLRRKKFHSLIASKDQESSWTSPYIHAETKDTANLHSRLHKYKRTTAHEAQGELYLFLLVDSLPLTLVGNTAYSDALDQVLLVYKRRDPILHKTDQPAAG